MKLITLFKAGFLAIAIATLSGCGTINAIGNLNEGAGGTFMEIWGKWVDSEGDIAVATMWHVKVEEGLEFEDVVDAINAVAIERNFANVGEASLSDDLKARGIESGIIYIMSFCDSGTARKMLDFSPAMSGFLPCRVTIVEQDDGLHIYTMNMDMMIKMGKKMNPKLREETMRVRNIMWEMLQRGSRGEF